MLQWNVIRMFDNRPFFLLGKVPTECFDQLFEDCGGVMDASSCGSLPRNKKQVSNMKYSAKPRSDV